MQKMNIQTISTLSTDVQVMKKEANKGESNFSNTNWPMQTL